MAIQVKKYFECRCRAYAMSAETLVCVACGAKGHGNHTRYLASISVPIDTDKPEREQLINWQSKIRLIGPEPEYVSEHMPITPDSMARASIIEMQGHKDDEGKPRYDLIPAEVLEALAKLYTLGAKKYDDNNWKKGLKYTRTYSALLRHLLAWWRGEEFDPDNGQHHLDSVIWNAVALRYFDMYKDRYKKSFDDRPDTTKEN